MKKQSKSMNPVLKIAQNSLLKLPSPSNISYMWNMGSLLGTILMAQIISGIFLSMHYDPNTMSAFESIAHIMREINSGWILRNIHMNGASTFFILMYIHISRGLMFSSFMKKETWSSGIVILLITMATAFLGYVLPWGQMSFWGATVITNLASAIPVAGNKIVQWLWGGFSVSNATLNRFFSLHFLMPFVILAMSMIHIISLHEYKSSNPLGLNKSKDMMKFHPFFSWKDLTPIIIMMMIMFLISSVNPNLLGDPENFNMANPMVTPVHIQPEWYFLFAYAILRAIPNKLGGVIALLMSIMVLFSLETKKKNNSSSKFNPTAKTKFVILASSFILLTWLGANPVEPPFEALSQKTSIIYFISMLTFYSQSNCLENKF